MYKVCRALWWGGTQTSKPNKSRLSDEENGAGVQVTLGRACGDTRCLYPPVAPM